MLELPADRRRDAHHLARPGLEVVEARANHGLHRVGQRQGLRPAFDDRLAGAHRHRALLDERTAHLLEKEGIAPGALEDAQGEPLRHAPDAEPGFDDRRRRGEVERFERTPSCPGRRLLERGRFGSGRDDEQKALASGQSRRSGASAARDALSAQCQSSQQHHERRLSGQHREERRQRVDQRGLQMFALQVPRKRVRLARHRQEMEIERDERLERRVDRANSRDELGRIGDASVSRCQGPAHDLDERAVRRHVTIGAATALQDCQPA